MSKLCFYKVLGFLNIHKCTYIFLLNAIIDAIIRLVGGSSYNEGRVEVYYNGEWGTVCDDGWDDTDAGVVCRQLGFGLSGTAIGSAGFGQGSGSILLDNILCTGNESMLFQCGHLGFNVTRSCSHTEDAAVRCNELQGIIIVIRYLCRRCNGITVL